MSFDPSKTVVTPNSIFHDDQLVEVAGSPMRTLSGKLRGMRQAAIHVVSYDPSWITSFEEEKALLEKVLAPWRQGPVEHVGSTAVPGLSAKPVIDVMVGVTSLAESEPAIGLLSDAGYQYAQYKTDVMHWFCKPSFAMRTHHLHLVPYDSVLWHDRLAFRDALRTSSGLAAEYVALKLELARKFEWDREAYTEGKSPFVARVLASIRQSDSDTHAIARAGHVTRL